MKQFKLLIITILLFIPLAIYGQVFDDFSDGNFSENPKWLGDTAQFIVTANKQLQLNGDDSGSARLYLAKEMNDSAFEWRFFIKLSFAPSGSNYARIYLCTNISDLENDSINGYYLQFGEAGSSDVIELFYQDNTQIYSICRGQTSIANGLSQYIQVVKRGAEWQVALSNRYDGVYSTEMSGISPSTSTNNVNDLYPYFGVQCIYTSGNRNKFIFDDFYIGQPIRDTISPELLSVTNNYNAKNQLTLIFSEAIDEGSIILQNVMVVESQSVPIRYDFIDADKQKMLLTFANDFEDRRWYHLTLHDISDLSGNVITPTMDSTIFYRIERNNVVISELMIDPTPIIGLPESEYIELHNTLPFEITLQEWKLRLGTVERGLPPITISANGYIIIVPANTCELWDNSYPFYSISSFNLPDDGQKVALISDFGEAVHYVHARKTWHRNKLKREGGWSLELIDVQNPCAGAENWDSSTATAGGTPGYENAIATTNPDLVLPTIQHITVSDNQHINVHFTEPITFDIQKNTTLFRIDHQIAVVAISLQSPDYQTALLTIEPALNPHIIYTLTIGDSIYDCTNNLLTIGEFARFGVPEDVAAGDVIINEILTNPFNETDGDYIELYNRSNKIIDLADLQIGIGNGVQPDNIVPIMKDGFLLFTNEYIAICKNKQLTMEQYITQNRQALIENEKLPSYPNDAGTVHLVDNALHSIDRFGYDKSMHYAMLQSTDGVALERIHFNTATQEASNWISAAEGAGWGTPGYRNSQWNDQPHNTELVHIEPDIFSPDGDGSNDFTEIYCRFPDGGYRTTIDIYNKEGFRIQRLADNQICGTEERFRWDGISTDNRVALNGLYVVLIKFWTLSGKSKTIRKSVALVRQL